MAESLDFPVFFRSVKRIICSFHAAGALKSEMDQRTSAPAAADKAAGISPRRVARILPLTLTPARKSSGDGLADMALNVIAPWYRRDYPGRLRAWVEISGQMPDALKDFRRGKRRPDIATIDRLIAAIEPRALAIAATLEALRAERKRLMELPRRNIGALAVDPVTGHDKRYRGAKTKKK